MDHQTRVNQRTGRYLLLLIAITIVLSWAARTVA